MSIGQRRRWEYWCVALRFSLLLCFVEQVSAQIRYSIPEEVKEGSVVGNVAKDLGLDVSTLLERRFRIVSGSKDALFQVNQNNGVLYVYKNIDREELCVGNVACVIDLEIIVENPLEVHYVGVEITDINDHTPSFSEKDIHIKIAENKLPGARFELQAARDLDYGINSVRTYKLNQNEHFDLELRDSGEGYKIPFLVLQKALDRELKTKHVLLLTALDGGNPPGTGTLNITVTVLDTNDNQPVCSQDVYSVTLQENADIGRIVVRVNATDTDHGSNGEVEYTLGRNLKRGVYDIFELDSLTGDIRVKGPVDFEDNEVYRLNIEASDKGQPPLTVDCRVIIKITDVNDNKPSIGVTSLSKTVSEVSKPGTVISLISVTDKDSGINGKVLAITSNDHFEIDVRQSDEDKIPFLVLKKSLDREQNHNYTLLLTAIDGGIPQRSGTLNVTIVVLDSNDNRPVFSQDTYNVRIQENVGVGTVVIRVNATDADEGSNSEVEFSLGKTLRRKVYDMFELDRLTGDIRVKGELDFEDTEVYKLDVQASDKGQPPLTVECRVIIKIIDINDNEPDIEVTSLSNLVSEDSKPGTVISLISVSDKDSGINGKVLCSLLGDVPFELKPSFQDNMYSLVTKKRLDRELVSHYDITITTTDCGQPPLSTFKILNVQISDETVRYLLLEWALPLSGLFCSTHTERVVQTSEQDLPCQSRL
uniref:Protocadherin alpha 8-like n=1 Tax=Oncorhynchus tshawytscha TaxID=74940 RepID=A0A8C8EH65_ONCTS